MHASLATGSFRSDTTFRDDPWRLCFPNMADTFPFDYPKLVGASYAEKVPLGTLKEGSKKRVAVIGAGIAGTQAARELVRAGFHVDIYEYTNRIGGRTYSTRVPATATTDGSVPNASLTSYEMGAMRIPFFNQYSPKPGPGPHVGGPYNNDDLCCTSMSELYALQYRIATTTFPNPGRGELPLLGGVRVDGTATGIYVSDGYGVDITTFYGDAFLELPTHRFVYSWPAVTSPLENWPASDPYAKDLVRFYNKGTPLMSLTPIDILLEHPLPMDDSDIPPVFLDKSTDDDDETRTLNISAWRKGVTAIRIISYKWSVFANAVRFTFLGDRSRYINPQATLHEDIFKKTQYNNNRTCGECSCEETSDHVDCRLWDKFWRNKVMPRYQNITFFEFATSAPVLPDRDAAGRLVAPIAWADGNFGGLGMSGPEAQLFYTIGAGDGSWGAFFPNSSLWALRALLFGFAQEHQLILGCLNDELDDIHPDPVGDGSLLPDSTPDTSPLTGIRKTFTDSNGKAFLQPQFAGVNSFSECHFFKPLDISVDGSEDGDVGAAGGADTLWKRVQSGDGSVRLFTSSKVTGLEATPNSILVTTADEKVTSYDHAICTVPLWNINEMDLINFTPKSLSTPVKLALDISHWIRSAKVFVALKEPFWQQGGATDPRTGKKMLFPQVMSTSSILRDVYGIVAPTGSNPYPTEGGMALISYTWEDDAQKFTAYESEDLVKMMLKRVEVLFAAFPAKDEHGNVRPKFSDFMLDPTLKSPGSYTVWQWSKQPSYHGCAKAYQTGIEDLSFALLTHNRTNARRSRLYFAGDAYSMESGWMEPAQRMSLDAVLNLLDHDEDVTMGRPHGFDFDTDYLHPSAISASQSSLTRPLGTMEDGVKNPRMGELPSAWGTAMSSNNLLRKRSSAGLITFVRTNSTEADGSRSLEISPGSAH